VPGGEVDAVADDETAGVDSAAPMTGGETGASVALGEDGLQAARMVSAKTRLPVTEAISLIASRRGSRPSSKSSANSSAR